MISHPEVCTRGVDTGFVSLGYAKVAVLGVVQGVTVLLPISSTAHMRVVPALLGWRDPGSAFSAAMQLAALAAVLSYFRSDVSGLAASSARAVMRRDFRDRDLRLVIWIILATAPIAVAGLLLAPLLNTCTSPLRGLAVIGWACLIMAILLALTELRATHRRNFGQTSFADAMLVGIAQVGALTLASPAPGPRLQQLLAWGSGGKTRRVCHFCWDFQRSRSLAQRSCGNCIKQASRPTAGPCFSSESSLHRPRRSSRSGH